VAAHLSAIRSGAPQWLASAELTVETSGEGLFDFTREVVRFLKDSNAGDGVLLLFLRHTSASLTIQENADPDVLSDLLAALERAAPRAARYRHAIEGPDDMPAHIKAMLTCASLGVPVLAGLAQLGTWQAIYLVEHRDRPHRREILLHFVGSLAG
jgi:secondary thiamine-phosphate synthase enzyme